MAAAWQLQYVLERPKELSENILHHLSHDLMNNPVLAYL